MIVYPIAMNRLIYTRQGTNCLYTLRNTITNGTIAHHLRHSTQQSSRIALHARIQNRHRYHTKRAS